METPSTNTTAANTTPASCSEPRIQTTIVGKKSSNPLPILDRLWDFYSVKGIKTVFVSVGSSSSPVAELEISESLGCPLHVVEVVPTVLEHWSKVKTILQERKATPETTCDFTNDVQNKWVLAKNVRISDKLPFFNTGVLEMQDGPVSTVAFDNYIESICSSMNLTVEQYRIDLLNVQLDTVLTNPFLYSLINSSYRPGLIIVSYPLKPDSSVETSILAGHLQNIGYMLVEKMEHKFLYMYNDKNVYEICSFENTTVDNPITYEIIKSTGRIDG
jgi:hypothetical protein